jgi:hypothetical protein
MLGSCDREIKQASALEASQDTIDVKGREPQIMIAEKHRDLMHHRRLVVASADEKDLLALHDIRRVDVAATSLRQITHVQPHR